MRLPRSGKAPTDGASKRPKRIATSGRNVEGSTYVITDHGGERMVRCKSCGKAVVVARWWFHGTAEDPHETPTAGM